jgi:hypothetical protein
VPIQSGAADGYGGASILPLVFWVRSIGQPGYISMHTVIEIKEAVSDVQYRFGLFDPDMLDLGFCLCRSVNGYCQEEGTSKKPAKHYRFPIWVHFSTTFYGIFM